MKKSDLKTGMKLITATGGEYIVLLDLVSSYTDKNHKSENKNILVNPKHGTYSWTSFDSLDENLLGISRLEHDVVEVLVPQHPYDVFYLHNGYKSIWKREQKSESQIQLEQVMLKLSELQNEAQRLQEIVAKENK